MYDAVDIADPHTMQMLRISERFAALKQTTKLRTHSAIEVIRLYTCRNSAAMRAAENRWMGRRPRRSPEPLAKRRILHEAPQVACGRSSASPIVCPSASTPSSLAPPTATTQCPAAMASAITIPKGSRFVLACTTMSRGAQGRRNVRDVPGESHDPVEAQLCRARLELRERSRCPRSHTTAPPTT